jgi:hypothetical protein
VRVVGFVQMLSCRCRWTNARSNMRFVLAGGYKQALGGGPGGEPALPPHLEEELAEWVRAQAAGGAVVSGDAIRRRAHALHAVARIGGDRYRPWMPSQSWVTVFKRRQGLPMRAQRCVHNTTTPGEIIEV